MKRAPHHQHFHINSYSDIENDINIFTNKAHQNISQTSYFQTDMNESMHYQQEQTTRFGPKEEANVASQELLQSIESMTLTQSEEHRQS